MAMMSVMAIIFIPIVKQRVLDGPQGGKPYGKKGRGSANYDDYDNQDYYDDQGEEGEGEERKSPSDFLRVNLILMTLS